MSELKLLVVEDDEEQLRSCVRAVEFYNEDQEPLIHLVPFRDVESALNAVDNTYDGALIDLRFGNDLDAGNEVIRKIEENELCIPVIVLSGTPRRASREHTHIDLITKGDDGSSYPELLRRFQRLHRTGVTKILGGRGEIQTQLGKIFRNQISKQIGSWERHAEIQSDEAERALLRHIVNHLVSLIDEVTEKSFAEEFYLNPSPSRQIRTGTILHDVRRNKRCVVMSPDCDVMVRNGGRKTNRILLVEIVHPTALFDWYDRVGFESMSNNKFGQLRNALTNNHALHYHCLPEAHDLPLGFMDFRKLKSLPDRYIDRQFRDTECVQIAPPFVKDIVSRFSSYYARQGQPEIDFSEFLGR